MTIMDLKKFAAERAIYLRPPREITQEAIANIEARTSYSVEETKLNFDSLFDATQAEAYELYLQYQSEYSEAVFNAFTQHLIETGELTTLDDLGQVLTRYIDTLDKFFLSLTQSRRSRAGGTFEDIFSHYFESLKYPFTAQPVVNGRPDFIVPSEQHYLKNPMDCIVITMKRTLRERWRQIITEGTRGLGFFLVTIDDGVSDAQLAEMMNNRVYLVCPKRIKDENYPTAQNVISISRLFIDYLDPAMERWRRNEVI